MKRTFTHALIFLATLILVGAIPAMPAVAAWQADQPAAKEQNTGQASSPFALPEKGQAAGAPAGGSKSPFALPEKSSAAGQPQAPAQSQSPFALPEKGQAAGAPAGKNQSPFALPEKKPETKTAPVNVEKLMDQGLAAAQAGQLDQAARAFAAAAQANPKDPKIWNNLGLTLRKQGKLHQAREAYGRALQADPGFAVTYKNLGVLLEQAGQGAKAAEAYLKYAQLSPQAPDAPSVKKRGLWLKKKKGGK